MKDASRPGQRFEGYASEAETDRKILHDVFKKGDVWFRTGDLMRKDKNGYFYFVDRIGDTFRWKGENVSTTEVEEVVGRFDGILETNVYGVQIPGRDGRAGMAAIVAKDNLNLTALRDHLAQQLPEYARPVFLRIRKDNDVTTTFKQKKINLLKEGFDPTLTTDPIYFNDPQRKAFVRVDPELYDRIKNGEVRL
jgi:fatty-acyl-CoA synthase